MSANVKLQAFGEFSGELMVTKTFGAPTRIDAIVQAVLEGYREHRSFLVTEADGASPALYWVAYPVNHARDCDIHPSDVRAALERGGH